MCTSDYLITVTSSDRNDNFDSRRAYSKTYVDIAAPGDEIFTIINKSITGTSESAPHVAGAIGLIYTLPCEGFSEMLRDNPSELSLKIKDALLDYSDKHIDLRDKTVSGGRLNALETYKYLMNDICLDFELREFNFFKIYPNPTDQEVKIEFETKDFEKYEIQVFNSLGQLVYKEVFRPKPVKVETKKIDVSRFANGVYYFSFISNEKTITKQIFVH